MGMVDQTVLFSAPNEIVRELLDSRLPAARDHAHVRSARPPDQLRGRRASAPDPDVVPDEPPNEQTQRARRLAAVSGRSGPAAPPKLNERYTFETFVIGDGNRFPHAAAVAVAEAPGTLVQPAVRLRRLGAGQDPPAARDRPRRREDASGASDLLRELRGVHQRVHQRDPRRQAAALPHALSRRRHPARSTTSSSWRTRSARRRSSSTPSTTCTGARSRSSSPPTARPSSCRRWRTGCAADSSGV